MYKAKITGKEIIKGHPQVSINYSNGTDNFTEVSDIYNQEVLNTIIKNRLAQLELAETLIGEIQTGDFMPTDPQPTQKELDKQSYQALATKIQKFRDAIDTGILQADDADFLQAIADAKALYDVDFLNGM